MAITITVVSGLASPVTPGTKLADVTEIPAGYYLSGNDGALMAISGLTIVAATTLQAGTYHADLTKGSDHHRFTLSVGPPVAQGFDPRTMTEAQVAAATGLQVDPSTLHQSGGVTVGAGTYENIDYNGRVTVETTGKVLFRNCRFNGGGDYYAVINVPEKFLAQEIRFEFCEGFDAHNIIAGANLYIYRCKLSNYGNGVNFWGPGQLVESYIHGPNPAMPEEHYDGTECNGGGDIRILRSYVTNSAAQTSALMFNNEFGALHDITIDGCYLSGGGYTVYFDTTKSPGLPTANVVVTNNTLKKGFWGWTALYDSGVVIDASNVLI